METMPSKLTLGERIVMARRRAGVTQDQVAKRCDTTRQQVSKWERGIAVPNVLELLYVADLTGYDVGYFTEDLLVDLRDRPGATSPCNNPNGSYDLRLFDPDGPDVVIDLRDHQMGDLVHVESRGLYAEVA